MSDAPVTDDWDEFDPGEYLQEYYSDLGSENLELLRFFAETYQSIPAGGRLLDFGGGPTLYPLISAAERFSEIHFSDFLEPNLVQVRRWLADEPEAFSWDAFISEALVIETGHSPSQADVDARAAVMRSRITHVMRCDASKLHPLEPFQGPYDVVLTNFCAESATSNRWEWRSFVSNILSVLKPGGHLVMSALKGATEYAVGDRSFPAVDIDEHDVAELLEEAGFPRKWIEVRSVPADRPSRDYDGLIFAYAKNLGQEE